MESNTGSIKRIKRAFEHEPSTLLSDMAFRPASTARQAEKTPVPGRQYVAGTTAVTRQHGSLTRAALPLRFRIRQYMRRNCPHSTRDTKATAQVLANLNLLERILQHVPCNVLLLSQRVCRTWQDTIIGSSQLQQSLFLEPCGAVLEPRGNPDWQVDHFSITPNSLRWAEKWSSRTAYAPIENPLMSKIFPLRDEEGRDTEGDSKVPTYAQLDAINRPEASWRKMFPRQPPVSLLHWYYDPASSLEHGKRGPRLPVARGYIFAKRRFEAKSARNERGLTLENIARQCLTICCPVGSDFRLFLQAIHTWRRPSAEVITAAALRDRLIEKYEWESWMRTRNMLCYLDGRFLHIYDDGPWSAEKLEAFRKQRKQLDALVRKAGAQGGRGHT